MEFLALPMETGATITNHDTAKSAPKLVQEVQRILRRNQARGKLEVRNHPRKNLNGFSLIELLIVVAIILIIAAIAIPNLLRARMAANESSAVASLRTINTAMIAYNTSYPTVGYAASLTTLGGAVPCTMSSSTACLVDSVLSSGSKSGYTFAITSAGGPPASQYYSKAIPATVNQTGVRSFCSCEDSILRVQPTGAAIGSEAVCQALSPLNQ
jgi:type IV pilus assembly protein PilA